MKAVLRKDLLLGGAAGTLLCAALIGAALSLGSLLGLDWPGGDRAPAGSAEAANLPAIPSVDNPTAEALRNQIRAPRIVDSQSQPTTRVNAPGPAARTPRTTESPSIVGRTPQTTSTPPVTPRTDSTGTPDAGSVPAPQPASPVVTPAAVIPATPVVTPAAKKLKLRVASVAVEPDDNGSPQLRLSLAVDRNGATSVAPAVNVTLRPKMPSHAAGTGPLALRAVVDVVDRPAADNSGEGSAQVGGMQMRVRMLLAPAASSAPAPTPTVADGGDGDTQSQSNVIALNVPLTAFVDPDDPAEPVEPTEPGTAAPAPAEPTEVRLDMPTTENPDAHPATDTANVPAPDLPVDHAPSDVPVTVVVDSAPAPDPAPAPAPTPDPAPAPAPTPDPAPAPADPTPAPPTTPPGYPNGGDDHSATVTTETTPTTPPADPAAATTATTPAATATTPAAPAATPAPDASSSGSGSYGS